MSEPPPLVQPWTSPSELPCESPEPPRESAELHYETKGAGAFMTSDDDDSLPAALRAQGDHRAGTHRSFLVERQGEAESQRWGSSRIKPTLD